MNNVLAALLGTQALDQDNNSYMVVGVDVENQIVLMVDTDGDSHTADFTELLFPDLKAMVKPSPIRAVENEEEESEEKPSKSWF